MLRGYTCLKMAKTSSNAKYNAKRLRSTTDFNVLVTIVSVAFCTRAEKKYAKFLRLRAFYANPRDCEISAKTIRESGEKRREVACGWKTDNSNIDTVCMHFSP